MQFSIPIIMPLQRLMRGGPECYLARPDPSGLYTRGPWSSSIIYKQTGENYQSEYDAAKPNNDEYYKLAAYNNADLGASYTFRDLVDGFKALKLPVNVFNLFNQQKITSISPGKTLLGDQHTYQAPRSYQLSLRADFWPAWQVAMLPSQLHREIEMTHGHINNQTQVVIENVRFEDSSANAQVRGSKGANTKTIAITI